MVGLDQPWERLSQVWLDLWGRERVKFDLTLCHIICDLALSGQWWCVTSSRPMYVPPHGGYIFPLWWPLNALMRGVTQMMVAGHLMAWWGVFIWWVIHIHSFFFLVLSSCSPSSSLGRTRQGASTPLFGLLHQGLFVWILLEDRTLDGLEIRHLGWAGFARARFKGITFSSCRSRSRSK